MNITGHFTKDGLELSAKLAAGTTLRITRVVAGSGQTGDPETASSLLQPCQDLAVNTPEQRGNTAVLPVTLAAAQAAESYTLTELGVYALDADKGEILYKLYKLDTPVSITAGSRLVLRFFLEETVSGDVEVSVSCSPAGLLTEEALTTAFEKRMVEKNRTIYVSKTGSDEAGNGSEAYPYLTIQYAVNSLPKYLGGRVAIYVHEGDYEEDIFISHFGGPGNLEIIGVTGEMVSVRTICAIECTTHLNFYNITLTGELSGYHKAVLFLKKCVYVIAAGLTCTTQGSSDALYGAVCVHYGSKLFLSNSQISNKQIAIDVMGGTAYLNSSVTGTGNAVAIRCGSGWGEFGGYVQKGGTALEGTEHTAYGGQIF